MIDDLLIFGYVAFAAIRGRKRDLGLELPGRSAWSIHVLRLGLFKITYRVLSLATAMPKAISLAETFASV
jgi:hypothetical protein